MKHADVFTTEDLYLPVIELKGEVKCIGQRAKTVSVPPTDPVAMFDAAGKLTLAYGRIEFVESLLQLTGGEVRLIQYVRRSHP
jgi:hypothetical protein